MKNLHSSALKHLEAQEENSTRVSKVTNELIEYGNNNKYLHNYRSAMNSPNFIKNDSDKKVDSVERRAVQLNDKNIVTEE